jgi:hypothetical protein
MTSVAASLFFCHISLNVHQTPLLLHSPLPQKQALPPCNGLDGAFYARFHRCKHSFLGSRLQIKKPALRCCESDRVRTTMVTLLVPHHLWNSLLRRYSLIDFFIHDPHQPTPIHPYTHIHSPIHIHSPTPIHPSTPIHPHPFTHPHPFATRLDPVICRNVKATRLDSFLSSMELSILTYGVKNLTYGKLPSPKTITSTNMRSSRPSNNEPLKSSYTSISTTRRLLMP